MKEIDVRGLACPERLRKGRASYHGLWDLPYPFQST